MRPIWFFRQVPPNDETINVLHNRLLTRNMPQGAEAWPWRRWRTQ